MPKPAGPELPRAQGGFLTSRASPSRASPQRPGPVSQPQPNQELWAWAKCSLYVAWACKNVQPSGGKQPRPRLGMCRWDPVWPCVVGFHCDSRPKGWLEPGVKTEAPRASGLPESSRSLIGFLAYKIQILHRFFWKPFPTSPLPLHSRTATSGKFMFPHQASAAGPITLYCTYPLTSFLFCIPD